MRRFIYRLYCSTSHSRRSGTDHTVLPANYTVRGGAVVLVVGRRTYDIGVAGSRPGRDAAAQQP